MPVTVIVAAYGPTRATRNAVGRARGLAGPAGRVFVFPGLVVGRDAARKSLLPGVEVIDEVGSDGLQAALDRSPEGRVLFVHDDVLVVPSTLDALVAEWERSGGAVVPYSNDLGMDHFCGTLPPVDGAKAEVERRARSLSATSRPALLIRPVCLLADRDDMSSLGGSHIVDPKMKIDVISVDVHIAPGAVVAHDSTCSRRLLPPESPDARPLVKAAMIVKNEEEMLPAALESFWSLCDEIVVVDTGSTDRTVEIAESMGATVVHREWRNDFGWARSEALDAASDAWWILSVDADDRLVCDDPVGLRRMLATYIGEYDSFGATTENRKDVLDGPVSTAFDGPRIFRGGMFAFNGEVHEVLAYKDKDEPVFSPRLELMTVAHLGYQHEVMESKDKADRNLALARTAFEEDPSPKHALEYARSIKLAGGDQQQAYDLMAKVIADIKEIDELDNPHNARAVAYVYTFMSDAALALGRRPDALAHAEEALERVPSDDVAFRAYARAALVLEQPAKVLEWHERRVALPSLRALFRGDSAHASSMSLLAGARMRLGDIEGAVNDAHEALSIHPETFETWADMAIGLCEVPNDEGLPVLAGLALIHPEGEFVSAVARTQPSAVTAKFCFLYCELGGTHPEAVRVGMAAALVSDLPELFAALARHVDKVDDETVEALAQRAEARNRPDLAAIVRSGRLQPAGSPS
ncbi:MAG: glycosyltransferase [Actinomycetota bacterium]